MSEEIKRSASERLEDLEKTVLSIINAMQPLDSMHKDLTQTKEALKLLNSKVNAISRSLLEGKLPSDEVISGFMSESAALELKGKVDQMLSSGILVPATTATMDSFVVINESDASGTIVNPRMQFLVSALQLDDIKSKLVGSIVGANIPVGNEGASINVLEIYTIVTTAAPEAAPVAPATPVASEPASATTVAPESTTAAPVASESTPAAINAEPAVITPETSSEPAVAPTADPVSVQS